MGCTNSAPKQTANTSSAEPAKTSKVFSDKNVTELYVLDKKKLGEGSYGSVCKASRKGEKQGDPGYQEFAVKQIAKNNAGSKDKQAGERIIQEIKIMKSLDHQNIIKLYDAFEDNRSYYLVMELCTGGELFDRIIEAGSFSESIAARIMSQIFQAMNYLHTTKFIAHRDLKPENFLMSNTEKIESDMNGLKIIDFGLSCAFTPGQKLKTKAGTPYYVAPEVLAGDYDEKSDMWSCGVIMFVLHVGYPPFYGESDAEVLKRVKSGVVEFSKDWAKISADCKALIKALLQKNTANRFTAEQALSHDWTKKVGPSYTDALEVKTLDALKKTIGQTKLKKLALKAIAKQTNSAQFKNLELEFKKLDKDGDGHLTVIELKEGMKVAKVDEGTIEDIFKALDNDGSGKVEYTEFLAATIAQRVKIEDNVLWTAFRQFDKDGNGKITKKELALVQQSLDNDAKAIIDENQMAALIQEADTDGDQQIDFEEFKAAVTGVAKKDT